MKADESWLRAADPRYARVRRALYAALDRLPAALSDAESVTEAVVMAAGDGVDALVGGGGCGGVIWLRGVIWRTSYGAARCFAVLSPS